MLEIVDGWQLLAYVTYFISPIVVGLVTKHSTSAGVKATLLAGITAVTTVGTEILDAHADGSPLALQTIVFNALIGFTVAVASHFGIWRPTGISNAAQNVLVKDAAPRNLA